MVLKVFRKGLKIPIFCCTTKTQNSNFNSITYNIRHEYTAVYIYIYMKKNVCIDYVITYLRQNLSPVSRCENMESTNDHISPREKKLDFIYLTIYSDTSKAHSHTLHSNTVRSNLSLNNVRNIICDRSTAIVNRFLRV